MLQGFTADGQDARLWLCEEGEAFGLLMFEWLKKVVVRRGDRSAVFTITRRTDFTSRARIAGVARIHRRGRTYRAGITELTQAASGVLTGRHGEVIVRDLPVERELIRLRFALGATPEVRAAMIGIALLYEHDFRR